MRVTAPVAKTAQDAINAKFSAVQCKYKLVPEMQLSSNHSNNSIGGVVPFTSSQDLYKDLLDKIKDGKVRRQAPLINAGYSIRVLAISSTILRLVKEKRRVLDSSKINLVFLGAGLDIVGIWACLIGTYDTSINANVQLYEVDCEENFNAKRDALLNSEILSKHSSHDEVNVGDAKILKGRIGIYNEEEEVQDEGCNFTLVSSDLRDISGLDKAFKATSFDSSVPTVVISELVLAYLNLDQSGSHTNDLLNYISSQLCTSRHSIFLAYEPVFPGNDKDSKDTNIVQGYGQEYFSQFVSKLDRGNARDTTSGNQCNSKVVESSSFAPIGKSSSHVIDRLRKSGFDGVVGCTPVAKAAGYITESIQPPELFDEYAALRLHLYCYSIICATGSYNGSTSQDVKNWIAICPWLKIESNNATKGSGRKFQREIDGTNLILIPIKCEHQEQVRCLFKESYTDFFEQFPSVRKLVKNALKSDLSTKHKTEPTTDSMDCAIWQHYCSNGGAFWIVTREQIAYDADNISKSQQNRNNCTVVGCIGVKKCASSAVSSYRYETLYEINRLAVISSDRGNGVGKALLHCAEDFVRGREATGKIGILATTPQVLHAANCFYSANGFCIDKESVIGSMVIRSFVKELM